MRPAAARGGATGAAVAVAGVMTFINLYAPQAILPALATSFHVPVGRTSLTVTAPLLAVALVAPFVGTISDRLGRKRLVVAAGLGLVVPTLLVAASTSLGAMILWRFVQGLLLPFIFAVTVAYIGDESSGGQTIRIAGLYSTGAILGGFLGRFVAGIAADFGGWRMAFVAIAAATLAGGAHVAAFLPPERNFRPVTGGLRSTLATYGEHLANPRLLATCVIGFGMLFCMVATFTYVNFYLAAPPFSLSPAALGMVFTVYLLGLATTSLATSLAARIGRRPTLAAVIVLAGAGLLLTLSPRVAIVIAGLALVAGGMFVVQALSLGFIGAAVARAKSTAVGLYVTTYYVGGALGGIMPAAFWRQLGWPGVVALLIALMALMLAAGMVFWRDTPARSA
ncbi:MAG: MFS transporter [Rhodospirillales bacterium]|nr:MFS transporter [Rhodospirillales bacterium]